MAESVSYFLKMLQRKCMSGFTEYASVDGIFCVSRIMSASYYILLAQGISAFRPFIVSAVDGNTLLSLFPVKYRSVAFNFP